MNTPTVGPILGFTTSDHARIFVRGGPDKNYPVFAGIRHRKAGDQTWSSGVYSKLSTDYDMSDTLVLNNLLANTPYEYQAGWFTTTHLQYTPDTVQQLPLNWPSKVYTFTTQSPDTQRARRYAIGSCRYLRLTLGVPSAPELGDEIFSAIQSLRSNAPLDALVMTGDQVYVDDLNIVAPDRDYPAISKKYRAAFSQPHIRELMAGTPTYMILDDHEIEDNWPSKQSNTDKHLYENAIRAYEIYQCSHGPGHALDSVGRLNRKLDHYWYTFADGNSDWFVMDCRTQRTLTGEDKRMLGVEQEYALCQWLLASTAKVKFVVSSVLTFPDQRNHGSDGWKGYAAQRTRILETIRTNQIKNVMFVSGDIHGSLTSQLTHSESPEFSVHCIVSSPLCNSRLLPYAKANNLILDEPLATVGSGSYNAHLLGSMVSQDNFACLTVDDQQLKVDFHDKKGRIVESTVITLA